MLRQGPSSAPPLSIEEQSAIRAWNMMGGEMQWAALPYVVEILGVADPAALIDNLMTVRDVMQARNQDK